MSKKNLIIGGVALALVALIAWSSRGSSAPEVQVVNRPLGSVTSPEISSDHISVNGVTTWTLRQNMPTTASTTLCSFPNPAGSSTSTNSIGQTIPAVGMATSTLIDVSVQITTGTSTAMTFDVATSTIPWATSTPALIYGVSVASGALFGGEWMTQNVSSSSDVRLTSSMPPINGNRNEVGPAQFVNVLAAKVSGAASGGYVYGGQCVATFRSLNAF